MTAESSRVVVVRAWRDSHRIIIRVLAGSGHTQPADEWVFADIDAACKQIENVLCELLDEQTSSAAADSAESLIRSIDADAHPCPGQ